MASAISHDFGAAQQKSIAASTKSAAKALADAGALPSGLGATEAAVLFARCYPLSPIAALVLPILCQKVAQNERTLFSYLGSHEEHGLQDVLDRFECEEDSVQLHHLFDYFVATISKLWRSGLASSVGRGCHSAERVIDAQSNELLKAIGLLNIIGARDGLKASADILKLITPESSALARYRC